MLKISQRSHAPHTCMEATARKKTTFLLFLFRRFLLRSFLRSLEEVLHAAAARVSSDIGLLLPHPARSPEPRALVTEKLLYIHYPLVKVREVFFEKGTQKISTLFSLTKGFWQVESCYQVEHTQNGNEVNSAWSVHYTCQTV